jgi:hypothetical protein
MAIVILFMGIASPLFTERMEVSTNSVLHQMERARNAWRPAPAQPAGSPGVILPTPVAARSADGWVR